MKVGLAGVGTMDSRMCEVMVEALNMALERDGPAIGVAVMPKAASTIPC